MGELVAVTGCHRSGTSAVAGGLKCLGAHLGPAAQLMPPSPDNPMGYFESLPVVTVHDRLLRRYGGSWDAPPAVTESGPMKQATKELLAVLRGFDDGARTWVVKDPRMSLFPLVWASVAKETGRTLRALVVRRDRAAVVRSLCRRDGMDGERAGWLHDRYVVHANSWVQGGLCSGAVISYEGVLAEPGYLWETAREVVQGLRFVDANKLDVLRAFVNPELNHG